MKERQGLDWDTESVCGLVNRGQSGKRQVGHPPGKLEGACQRLAPVYRLPAHPGLASEPAKAP